MKMAHITELEKLRITQPEGAYTRNHNPTVNDEKHEIRVNGLRHRILIMIDGVNDGERVHDAQRDSNLGFSTPSNLILLVS